MINEKQKNNLSFYGSPYIHTQTQRERTLDDSKHLPN